MAPSRKSSCSGRLHRLRQVRASVSAIDIFNYETIMNTATKLKVCNRWLAAALVVMLVSGIQLEATGGKYAWSVWVHIALGVFLTGLAFYHIFLHNRKSNWFSRFSKNRNTMTRILWWVFLLTEVSGVAATVQWLCGDGHSPLGGIHGKIGSIMVIVATIHAVKHVRKKKKKKRLLHPR